MFPKFHFLFTILFLSSTIVSSQNYLRVADPNWWNGPISIEPGWHEYQAHAALDEITIIAEPQGIYTEIGFYATISQGPDAYSWTNEYEIVWQFDLPANAIVHDSWLWVGSDIIRADIIDYWTALQTYEDIVDRNQDPSFFYRLPDNRYEIRIYPLFDGDSRRIKMSFLIPTEWDAEQVKTDLLNNLLKGTDYTPSTINIGMIVDNLWENPAIQIGQETTPMLDTVLAATGELMHYETIPTDQFLSSSTQLILDPPFTSDQAFLSTYEQGGEQFYQVAFTPDWNEVTQDTNTSKSLFLVEYNETKFNLSLPDFIDHVSEHCHNHFSPSDYYNIGIVTKSGTQLLSDQWLKFKHKTFGDTLLQFASLQDTIDLATLLNDGFAWANAQPDIDHIYLFAANDEFVYPPAADDIFANIAANIPTDVPFTLVDYQSENISVIYYGGEEYHGNEYFYNLLENAFNEPTSYIYNELGISLVGMLTEIYPPIAPPSGIIDYSVSMENGICFNRYNLNNIEFSDEKSGALLQTGKYLGEFPMNINASLVTDDGSFWQVSKTINENDIVTGDTLMREMWYGSYLREKELLAANENDRLAVIEESINERVLTGLTAFLALEPSQGGEPCIECLLNAGGGVILNSSDEFSIELANIIITPNPSTDRAKIILEYETTLSPTEWKASIYDASGKLITLLNTPTLTPNGLIWEWEIEEETRAGFYFCKIESEQGSLVGKVVVVKN